MKKTHFSFTLVFCLFLFSNLARAQMPNGTNLLQNGLKEFTLFGATSSNSIVEVIPVNGQSFSNAFAINTFDTKSGNGNLELIAHITSPLHKGDVLWISFKSRCIESKRETGEALFELRFDKLINGKYVWPPHLALGISFGKEWTETSLPFVISGDVTPKDVRLVIALDSYPQRFEISPVTFINCGNIKISSLPRSKVRYEGCEPDAPWRKVAADNIEKYRKGDLLVKVTNGKGQPVKGADVEVRMKRIAFNWGTAVTSQRILDSTKLENRMYRDTLLKYFNQVVFENEMKWGPWNEQLQKGIQTQKAIKFLNTKDISSRGHVMVWPSWENSPDYLIGLKNDTALLRSEIINHIKEQTSIMKGQFSQWDVLNEPYAHNDFLKMLGRDVMVKWFKTAREGEPNAKLFLNDYTMFHGEGPGSASQTFYDNVKFLKDNHTPIDAIGEQGHIGGAAPSLSYILSRLDYFATLGLPIQISEFDINSNDDDYKARYMSDFMTAIFSHPATIGFVQWGFWEDQHWFPSAALWNKDWSVRQNGKAYTNLVTKTWWTNFDGKTTKDGTCKTRGFCGNYEIIVKYAGKTVKKTCTLNRSGEEIIINL